MDKQTTLKDLCSFTGFQALARVRQHQNHSGALIITLRRRQKKRFVPVVKFTVNGMTPGIDWYGILMLLARQHILNSLFVANSVRGARL